MARIEWTQVPEPIRERIARAVGVEVREARTQMGGFSAGVAARLLFADGKRAFVKATPASAEGTFDLYRREAEVLRRLPEELPAARLVVAFAEGEWMVLVIEDVDGRHPRRSAASADTVHVLDSIDALRTVRADRSLPLFAEELEDDALSWARIEAAGMLPSTTAWCESNVELLRTAAERAPVAVAGESLVHGDLRADNILIDGSGRARLLDWPWAARGAGWEDALLYLLDLRVADASAEVTPLLAHPVFRDAESEDFVALLAAVAGSWFEKCRLPAPPGMTTVRAFQRSEAVAAVEWVAEMRP